MNTLLKAIEFIGWAGLAVMLGVALFGLTWAPTFPDSWDDRFKRKDRER